jgi:glycosyltransferase involved in cell wall biosynthesis
MKILYGITKSNFGGAQRYVFDLARYAKKAGHEVAVVVGEGGALTEKLKNHGVRVIQIETMGRDISPLNDIRSFLKLLEILDAEKPDVFHTNSSKMGGIGGLAGRIMGVKKIIFTSHGWAFNEPRPAWQKIPIKFLAWLTLLLCHKTICVSEKTREQVQGFPFVRNKLVVVRNSIESFDLLPKSEARKSLGIPEDPNFVVGTLAELHPIKGLDILIEAWEKFVKKHNAQLVILGEGEARADLEELAEVLGVKDSIIFKGYVEDAKKYLNAFDIFVLPSRSENLPYALLEAGLSGLPVIATNVGGIPEIVETGTSGVLVDPEEPDTLFSTLILLAENKDLRKRLGEKLRENILKNFSLKRMAGKTLEVYS